MPSVLCGKANSGTERLWCILIAVSLLSMPGRASDKDLARQLNNQFAKKIFVLRNFYRGAHLAYDSSARLVTNARPGDWSGDGIVEIENIHLSHQKVRIRANRLVAFAEKPNQLSLFRSQDGVEIEVEMATDPVNEVQVAALWSSIFLNQRDRFVEVVPEYWKACVQLALSRVEDKTYSGCHFSDQLAQLLGTASYTRDDAAKVLARNDPVESLLSTNAQGSLQQIRKDISPPRQLFYEEPEFSECARRSHLQGTLTLTLVVDETGAPKDIRVAKPLGCDLDANAVDRVKQWKFKPAEKHGQPVQVEIGVEVNFHQQ